MQSLLKSRRSIEVAASDRIFYALIGIFLGAFTLSVLLPLIFVVAASFSAPEDVVGGRVFLWPVNPTLDGYAKIFENQLIGTAYFNTFFYTIAGTAINLAMTLIAAYPLARRHLPYKGIAMFLFTFTMLFSGGIIPNYMVMLRLNMINTRWAMILPGAISV
ncbi:MAG TPA: carbohydrate ABC transporter permease, partial [Clostridia bacterium]|nr:carbohydrate ABC transporter permease [Clostridia bacterium]